MATPDTAMNLLKNVRKYIFEHFEEHAIAPVLEQIMQKFELDRTSAFNALVDLQSARHIALLPGTQRILMAFPFSSIVTPFKVRIARKEKDYFANCAWDAVAIHVAVGKEQWIDSYCHHCAEEMTIQQTLKLSVPIYKNKMTLDYARPSREQTIAHFQSLGLTGDFWKI